MSDPMSGLMRGQLDLERRIGQTEVRETPRSAIGTWTPELAGSTVAGTFTYAATTGGNYTRMGSTVFFSGRITISTVSVAPTGNLRITGLPFTATTVTSGTAGGVSFDFWSLVNLSGAPDVYLGGWIQSGATTIDLLVSDNNGGAARFLTGAGAAVGTNTDISFRGQYQIV